MNYYDHIEDYCFGKLDNAFQLKMEAAMADDLTLAEAVIAFQEEKNISEALMDLDIAQVVHDLQAKQKAVIKISTVNDNKNNNPKPKRRLWYGVAASLALLVVAGIVLQSGYSDKALFEAFNNGPTFSNIRSANNPSVSTAQLEKLWNDKSYNAIVNLSADDQDPLLNYLKAHSYTSLQQYDEADAIFASVIKMGPHEWVQDAEWQMALICVQQGKVKEAKNKLNIIENNVDHAFAQQAKKLLKKLNSPLRKLSFSN